MKKYLLVTLFASCILSINANSQYVTGNAPVQDGNISSAEYYNSTGNGWYMCWDNSYLYIARSGATSSEPCIVYLDVNPNGVNNGGAAVGTSGSLIGKNDYNVTPNLPFIAKARLYFITNGGNYAEVTTNAGSGWSSATTIITQMGTSSGSNFELKVSWAQLGAPGGTIPSSFNWLGTETSTGSPGYIYAVVPSANYTGNSSSTPTYYFYQTVANTANGSATNPFDANYTSHTNYNTTFNYTSSQPATLYDINLGSLGSAGTTSLQTDLTVKGNIALYNGGLNVTGGIGKTLHMAGVNQTIRLLNSTGGFITGTDNGLGNDLALDVQSGTTTFFGDATTNSDHEKKFFSVNVASGATLALNRGILVRYGAFNVSGTLQINTNGYIQSGVSSNIAAKYIGAASKLNYNNGGDYTTTDFEWQTAFPPTNVTIQNTGTNAILNNNKTVSGTLTLTTGKITTGSNTLSVGAAGSVSRTNGWVNGNLSRAFNTGSSIALTYDIGNATSWMPTNLNITSATVAGSVTVATVDGKHANYSSSGLHSTKCINRYWNVTVNGGTFTGAQLQFNYLSGDLSGGAVAANIKGVRYTGSAWAYPVTSATTSYSFTNTGLTNTTLGQSYTGGECAGNIVLPAFSTNSPVCANSTLTLTGSAVTSGGIGTISYSWVGPNSFSASALTTSISNATTAATGSYTLTATDVAACIATTSASATVNANVTPSVSISPSSTSSTSQTFTATASNTGGGAVTYTFLKGISAMQSSVSNTWNATGLANGDNITCGISIVGGACLTSSTAFSSQATVCITGVTPALGITPTTATNAATTFTANVINSMGGVVTYNFKKNNVSQQNSTSSTWAATGLVTGDVITCSISIAGGSCLTQNTANSSNSVTACVSPATPSVSIVADNNPICSGSSVIFTATPTNAVSPTYAWLKGITQVGTGTTYNSSSLSNGDVITCVMTASNACGTSNNFNSNTVVMTVHNSSSSTTAYSSCGSYTWNGQTYSVSGSYSKTFANGNANGCDSTATLNLTVNIPSSSTTNVTACGSYTWNGQTYSVSGTYSKTFTSGNAKGCDSTATLNLTVNNPSSSTTTYSSCGSYTWNGQTYSVSGSYSKTFANGNANGCDSTATLNLTVNTPNTWTGATNSDWSSSSNWSCGSVPSSGADITIPVVTNYPVLASSVVVGNINLPVGTSLSINGNTLTINGTITGTGKIKGSSTSSLIMNSASANTVYLGTTATDSLLSNFTVSGSGSVTLASGVGVNTLLSVSGALNTGNHLTLKSTSIANTAVVGVVTGSVTGNVTVERYIPQGVKAYRSLIAGGVYNAGTVFNNWQESGVNTNGYGIFVTGKVGSTNGIDPTTGFDISPAGNKSMYNYFNYLTYTPVTNTKTINIDPYTGYLTVVYGNRTFPLIPAAAFDASTNMHSAATIRTTGALITGTVTYSNNGVVNSGYSSSVTKILPLKDTGSFIANPYACAIDWESLSRTNLTTSYYYYEPTYLNGGYQSFVSYNATSHTNSNPTKSKINRYIQPGQGFWVQTNSTVTTNRQLVITESNKVTNQPFTAVFGTGASGINRLAVSLWSAGENIDGAVAVFDNSFTSAYGDEDSKKMFGNGERLFIQEGSNALCIDGRAIPSVNDMILLQTAGMTVGKSYVLQLDAQELNTYGLNAYLVDATLQTEQLLTNGANTFSFVAFKINDNRFTIVFKAGGTLPVKFISVNANQDTDKKTNLVAWIVANESDIDHYEVEKSVTGKDYAAIYTVSASNHDSYSALDKSVNSEVNYYRIKAVGKDGRFLYSSVVKVNNSGKGCMVVVSNPVRENKITIQLNNLESGKYIIKLYNSVGQVVASKEVNLNVANTTIELPLSSSCGNGLYSLCAYGTDNYTTEVLLEK